MSINAEALEAELRTINLWDRLFASLTRLPKMRVQHVSPPRASHRAIAMADCASGGHLAAFRREKEVRHERSLI
jgi:hypothetical protein